eukprot:837998-Prorocentrum_minimum.AAC.2
MWSDTGVDAVPRDDVRDDDADDVASRWRAWPSTSWWYRWRSCRPLVGGRGPPPAGDFRADGLGPARRRRVGGVPESEGGGGGGGRPAQRQAVGGQAPPDDVLEDHVLEDHVLARRPCSS